MFYSNCLLEAIKHKLKDWKHIKIIYTSPKYNEMYCPHFMWSDGIYDYDFGVDKCLKWYEVLWFKGEIRTRRLESSNRWKKRKTRNE